MLATAGTMIAAVTQIKNTADYPLDIRALSIIAAPEGIAALTAAHPDIQLYVCAVDLRLNDKGYILPGLGDAGDRAFGIP